MNAIVTAEEWTPPTGEEIMIFAKWALATLIRPNTRDDADELLSIIMESITESLGTHDPTRAKWTTYAMAAIRWRIFSHRRAESIRAKHVRFAEFTTGADGLNGRLKPGQLFEPVTRDDDSSPQEQAEFWATALAGLSDREAMIVRRRVVDGEALAVIGGELGLSGSRVAQIAIKSMKRIRRNLDRAGLGGR